MGIVRAHTNEYKKKNSRNSTKSVPKNAFKMKEEWEKNKREKHFDSDRNIEHTRYALRINVWTDRWRVSNRTGTQKPLNAQNLISFSSFRSFFLFLNKLCPGTAFIVGIFHYIYCFLLLF